MLLVILQNKSERDGKNYIIVNLIKANWMKVLQKVAWFDIGFQHLSTTFNEAMRVYRY